MVERRLPATATTATLPPLTPLSRERLVQAEEHALSLLKKYDSNNSGSLDRAQLKALLVDMVGDGHEVSDDEVRWDRIAEMV